MSLFETFLIGSLFFLILSPEMSHFRIVDFSSDNSLFHPFVQKMRNYRSKDYLIKLLKRNLEQKLRKIRKLNEEKMEGQFRENAKVDKPKCNCNCKCNERNFRKRCEHCEHCSAGGGIETTTESEHFKNFVCQQEGSFANPDSCRQFYICFHNEPEPIGVTCPKGFAFDSAERKCTRKAARQCIRNQLSIYTN
ncbi:uncharacterized protein LOC123005044 [Tribolium madens]|uniref:uncharacterized protein LOC123005044 n=1 Tax=Tribolium madens TaxID=41895 RepID=UPI001CF739A6|nr:uncharacterized protein LOC123005044 [Tribolium madens]